MGSRFARFRGLARQLVSGQDQTNDRKSVRARAVPNFVQLEDRVTPATFVVTNTLDSVSDLSGGLSLRQAILAANNNPGHDDIVFNIPISPSLPRLPTDPNLQYFPIVLATTLPDMTDPFGVTVDASTQPRVDVESTRPLVQLLPNPNKGAFPNEVGAFNITGQNNVIRGFVITGFPGSAINITGLSAKNNYILGNWINTDITGLQSWNQDPIILQARPPGTPPELTNAGPVPNTGEAKFVISGITLSGGTTGNVIGGMVDSAGVPLLDGGGKLVGTGGSIFRFNNTNPAGGIAVTNEVNRNVISGTPEYRKDYFGLRRDRIGAGVGPGIRIMDPGTSRNLVQGNFIGTDVTGEAAIPNYNGIEIFNAAASNTIGNLVTSDNPNLIRFNLHDGVRIAETPQPTPVNVIPGVQIVVPPPAQVKGAGVVPVFYDHYSPNYFVGTAPSGNPSLIDLGATVPRRDATGQFANVPGIDPDDYGPNPTTSRGAEVRVGTKLTIRGQNLLGTTSVSFFGDETGTVVVQAKFKVVDDATVEVTVPEGAVTGNIIVSTAGGVFPSAGQVAQQVVVLPADIPQLNQVSNFAPSSGVAGDRVTIAGSNFGGTLQVLFNGQPASQYTVLDVGTATERIEAIVPIGAGTGPITIQNPAGQGVSVRDFVINTEPPPTIDSLLTPSGVPGQQIILSGSGFTSTFLVRFAATAGASGFATADFIVDSPTQLRVRIPANATATLGPIQVQTAGGVAVSRELFQITAPGVPVANTLSTTSGVVGSRVIIDGVNLQSVDNVTVGSVPSPSVKILGPNTIQVEIPQVGIGPQPVVVTSLGGASVPLTFTVTPSAAPTADAIVGVFRNSQVIITGTNLLGTSKILFGSPISGVAVTTFEVLSPTAIRAIIPAGASTGNYFVFTPGGVASNSATLLSSGIPVIGSAALANPVSAPVNTIIELNGQGLLGTQDVFFPTAGGGRTPALEFTIVNDAQILVKVPIGAVSGPITIETQARLNGQPRQTVDSAPFTVAQSFAPVITSFSPGSGPVGTVVTVSGSGLTSTTGVTVGGVPVPTYTIRSDNQLEFRIPGLAVDGPIQVTTSAGLAITTPALFGTLPAAGTTVTVTGSGFAGATALTVGGVSVPTTQFNLIADTRFTFVMPAGAANGTIDLTKPAGTGTPTGTTFDVTTSPAPTITFSTPGSVRNAQILVQGTGLLGTQQVFFNSLAAQFSIVSDNQINVTVPDNAVPGTIRVITTGGSVISPTDFRILSAAPPVLQNIVNVGNALTIPDIGVVGSRFFLNGASLQSIFRVDLTEVDENGNTIGTPVVADLDENTLSFRIPDTQPGLYQVNVFASTDGRAVAEVGAVTGAGSNGDTTTRATTNIVGQRFVFGDILRVMANPRPIVDRVISKAKDPDVNITSDEDRLLRGVPISIFGSGFTGAEQVSIGGQSLTSDQFRVISDEEIQTNLPNNGGQFNGIAAITGAKVTVTTPSYAQLGSKTVSTNLTSQEDLRIDIADSPPLAFTVPDGGSTLPGFSLNLTAAAGSTFYGVNNIRMSGIAFDDKGNKVGIGGGDSPFFRDVGDPVPFINFTIASNGKTATAQIPTTFSKLPDPPQNTAKLGFLTVVADNNETNFGIQATGTPTIRENETPNITAIRGEGTPGGAALYNRRVRLVAPPIGSKDRLSLVSVNSITFDIEFPIPNAAIGKFTIGRDNIQLAGVDLIVELPAGSYFTNSDGTLGDNIDRNTDFWATGPTKASSSDGDGTATATRATQPVPSQFTFNVLPRAPLDNRILAQPIFDNGATVARPQSSIPVTPQNQIRTAQSVQDQQFIDGDLGIDFVTRLPGASSLGIDAAALNHGYDRDDYQAPSPLWNFGRGGLNDGFLNSFISNPASNGDAFGNGVINTFNNVALDPNNLASFPGGRFYGPNNLQNFPLLQVVQSTTDRTSFNTALVAKPFRPYRIDYYYNPGFDDQDVTALQTSNAGYGEIFLGSKVITTDFQGNGSILFSVGVKQPDADGNVTFGTNEFRLPNNQPLPESVNNPGRGVVVSTATDLTAPGLFGPSVSGGPDGTSRYSYFRRVDTSSGAITGQVLNDKNLDSKVDSKDTGVGGVLVQLFLQQVDGSLSPVANSAVTTDDSGSFSFSSATDANGLGLPNGTHLIKITLPTGKDLALSVPGNGQLNGTIVGGETVSGINFLVTGSGVAAATGKITGQVIHDVNTNGILDAGEVGIAKATISLFPRLSTGSFSAAPTQTFTTDATGVYTFGTPPAGAGLGNGGYQVRVTLPTGKDYTFFQPNDGIITTAITAGETVSGKNFFVGGTGDNIPAPPPPPLPPPAVPPIVPGAKILAIGADFGGGPSVGVYNQLGSFQYQFFAYDTRFTGGVRVATGDVTGDGKADVITAPGPGTPGLIKIFDGTNGAQLSQFQPYEDSFVGGVYVATGDIDGDGVHDIITGTGNGGGPRVQVFRGGSSNFETIVNFFPYEETFRGGVLVAGGDVNGDGRADITTGTGIGGGPRIQVFSGTDFSQIANFFAYESTFRGGVFASVGDLDGDNKAEVISGTGVGGGPVVKVFNQANLQSTASNPTAVKAFFAFDPSFRGGVRVDSIDGNNDGKLDIVVAPGPGENPLVRVLDFANLQDVFRSQAFEPEFLGGVFVGGTH